MHPALYLFFLIPIAVPVLLVEPFFRFFRQSQTPDVVAWIFLGFLVIAFGVLPAHTALNAFLKSRRGRTTITVSTAGVRIEERRVWKTRTLALLAADDIMDVDYATPKSAIERLAQVGGVTIKTRQGLTTFAQGLDDREMRYLHYVVKALRWAALSP